MERTLRRSRRLSPPAAVALLILAIPAVAAQEQQPPSSVTLVPTADTAPSGSCNELTARVTSGGNAPVSGATVDVRQVLLYASTEPQETQELSFCNPSNPTGPNPTGQGGTAFGDVSGNNQASTAGQAGRNADVHAEVGPTDANGEVTLGVTINAATFGDDVVVTAWWELEDDDELDEGEPSDGSTITWVGSEDRQIVSVDATPESAHRPNGGQHEVTVRLMTGMGPAMGAVPSTVIVAGASGRSDGDVVDPSAGSSPNFPPGDAEPAAYSCTPTDNEGVSSCTFQDPVTTGTGTDTVVFYVDEFGEGGLDGPDPQDAVQVTWFAAPPPSSTPTPTPTPPPTPNPAAPEARNVRLCHGTADPATCDDAAVTRQTGDEHLLAALVTDGRGSPLQGVPVQLRVQGVGAFEPGGAISVLATTGPDGVALATLGSEIDGVSSVVAEISPPGTAGSFRGAGPADDECEQPSGGSGASPEGNCVSKTLTVSWHDGMDTICSDGVDNDGDGLVDFGEDPGCTSEEDDSETPAPHPDSPVAPHDRTINMRFRDPVDPGDERLVIFGRVRLEDDDGDFSGCTEAQPVRIQRRVDRDWKTVEDVTTNARGRYAGAVTDRPGRYRAVALRTDFSGSEGVQHVCRKAAIAKTHHHRR